MPTGNLFTSGSAAQTMMPTDYSVQQQQLMRQQAMADLLRKQSLDPMGDTQSIGGWAIQKSPLEGVAKMAQALGANYAQSQTDEKQLALAKQLRETGVNDMQGVMAALQGAPEKTADFVPDSFDASDKADNLKGGMQTVTPAVAPDRRQAMALALNSQNPMVQGVGSKLLESELKAPEWTLGERFNDKTGMAEKFMYNKNNPSQMQAIGGQQADKVVADNTGGALTYRGEHSITPLGTVAKTVTPDAVLSSNTTMRGQNMVDARKREELRGQEQAFTPGAIENAAARYNIDGTLPPMGMGKTGAMGRSAILNKAAELANASGVSGDDQRINQIGNKANTAALSKLQQQQTMVGAFERNFTRNADIALEYSAKTDHTGVPLANKWINAGKRAVTGDPDLSAYDASIKATANEYAKIISGSMGNTAMAEGEIKKVEGLLNAAQTPAQVTAVINMMKRETQNRMKGFDEEKASLRGSMGGKQNVSTPKITQPAASGAKFLGFE